MSADQTTAAVLRAVLRQGTWMSAVSLGLWAFGALALVVPMPVGARFLLASLAVGLLAQYAGLRVRLDADLVDELLRDGCDRAAFDAALGLLLGHPFPDRPIEERLAGTLRWWRRLAALLTVQWLLVLAAIVR